MQLRISRVNAITSYSVTVAGSAGSDMVAITSTNGTPSTAACSMHPALLCLASALQAYRQGRTMGWACASQTSTGSTQLCHSHSEECAAHLEEVWAHVDGCSHSEPPRRVAPKTQPSWATVPFLHTAEALG